ncbi:hypothetical protein A2U01_0019221, partial [Trifolium medium]|nr:hypothetical protein [Trifolium medium]
MAGTELENGGNKELKEETSLGLIYRKAENFKEWYSE